VLRRSDFRLADTHSVRVACSHCRSERRDGRSSGRRSPLPEHRKRRSVEEEPDEAPAERRRNRKSNFDEPPIPGQPVSGAQLTPAQIGGLPPSMCKMQEMYAPEQYFLPF
jgi:hypothetical protein